MGTGGSILSGQCRILHLSHWNLVRQLRLEALRESPEVFLGDYDQEVALSDEYWQATFDGASWHAFLIDGLAMTRDKIAGIAKSTVLRQFPDERYVESFWVRPRYRHQQVGRRMMHNIIREARRDKRRVIRLSVLRTNQEGIKAFHSLGLSAEVPDRSSAHEICLELPLARRR